MGDTAANPYVLVATILQAALLGLNGGYDLPAPEGGDCLSRTDASDGVPTDLRGAHDTLEADPTLVAALGATLVGNHVAIKRAEVKETELLEGDALRDYYINYL